MEAVVDDDMEVDQEIVVIPVKDAELYLQHQSWSYDYSPQQQLQTIWGCCLRDMLTQSNLHGSSWKTSEG